MLKRSALMLGAAVLIGTIVASPAAATKQSGKSDLVFVDYGENEGNWTEWWVDEEDRTWVIIVKNYEIVDVVVPEGINPGPDGDEGSPGDLGALLQMLKQHGGKLVLAPAFAKTPLGKKLTEQGKGLIPVHNPSDLGAEHGYGEGFGGSGGGFDPGAGTPQQQAKKKHKQGNKNGGEGDDGSDLKPSDHGLFDDDMPGPPELVNPNPVGKITEGGTRGGGAQGGGGGGAAGR